MGIIETVGPFVIGEDRSIPWHYEKPEVQIGVFLLPRLETKGKVITYTTNTINFSSDNIYKIGIMLTHTTPGLATVFVEVCQA